MSTREGGLSKCSRRVTCSTGVDVGYTLVARDGAAHSTLVNRVVCSVKRRKLIEIRQSPDNSLNFPLPPHLALVDEVGVRRSRELYRRHGPTI